MIARDEVMYYLVREMDGLGIRAGEKHFTAALEHVKQSGLAGFRRIEVDALVEAARLRNREQDLDQAVEQGERSTHKQQRIGVE